MIGAESTINLTQTVSNSKSFLNSKSFHQNHLIIETWPRIIALFFRLKYWTIIKAHQYIGLSSPAYPLINNIGPKRAGPITIWNVMTFLVLSQRHRYIDAALQLGSRLDKDSWARLPRPILDAYLTVLWLSDLNPSRECMHMFRRTVCKQWTLNPKNRWTRQRFRISCTKSYRIEPGQAPQTPLSFVSAIDLGIGRAFRAVKPPLTNYFLRFFLVVTE